MNPGAMMTSYEDAKGRRGDKTEKRLKFIAPLRNERTEATSDHADYLGLENIQSWTGKLLPSATSDFSEDDNSASGTANVFYSGDVLFGKLRPYLAKALHADKDGVCSTELLVLKPQPDIHPRFLLYSMLSPDFVGQVDASTFGAKMPRANWEFIGSMKLSIPTYETQRLIADYLDRETGRIDALVAEKEKMLALLEEKRAALISRVVTRGLDESVPRKPSGLDWLGEIPEHWEVLPFRWFMRIGSGEFLSNERISKDKTEEMPIPVVGGNGVFGYTSQANTEDALVIGRVGAQCGNVHFVDGPLWVTDNALLVENISRFEPRYLREVLCLIGLNTLANQSAQPLITGEIVKDQKIPSPPISEQSDILQFLKGVHGEYVSLHKKVKASLHLLQERRAALITAAVTGRIPVEEMTA
ncbi:MAG: Type I restriction modification DNA specificity domain protein [Lentisphaerae bacterium ADurb.Bin082]|nr:MAG: Type I restriction modification DNA specificity domain protein [Lentisphaerae bacterium ADurb.Bin082]